MPTSKANAKKERILQSALSLFSRQGYHATTTKEIAAESGVAEGLIFYHFGDKRKLLLDIVRNFSFIPQVQADANALAELSTEEALVRYGMKYLEFLKLNQEYIMLIWSPEFVNDAEVSAEVARLIGGFGTAGRSVLKRPGASGPPQEFTVQVAMMMITSSILVYFMLHSRFGEDFMPLGGEAYVRELVRLLMHEWS